MSKSRARVRASKDANAVHHCRFIAYVDTSTYMLAEFVARTKLTHVGPG